ncbi:MAG TPA: metal ABC transporter ATP-binding protein [Candidatus Paceibacterota bacterium]|jgi:zinc transport system ATP-binding protein|nr:metal ABC transporter ATP-binding protein [Candidatus Paceibacterota bacterium]
MQVNHSKNIIELKNISFSYGKNEVLKDISLEVHQGDYLGIIGPNGAGKTTLLKIMLGLLIPASGSVKIFGQDILDFKDWQKIGYVPQKATNFDDRFPATVREVVLMGRYARAGILHGIKKKDEAIVEKSLKQVGVWELRDRLIGDLSGGQQQRVFIARALATEPEVILLDEPTTGVDQKTQDEFYALLKKLNQELALSLVLVSHDTERIIREVMHIACIDTTLVCHLSPEDYVRESQRENVAGSPLVPFHHHPKP